MIHTIRTQIEPNGDVHCDYSGFANNACQEESSRMASTLAEFGLQLHETRRQHKETVPTLARLAGWARSTGCLAMTTLILAGCSYPMGLSKQQWNSLPPEQQAQYQAQQHALDVERRRELEARQAEERREAAAREEQERERIAAIARAPQPGDVITVHISGGQIAFFGRRAEYEPIIFDLVRGEKRFVEFPLRGNPGSLSRVPVRFSEEGNTFYFDETALHRIVIINDGWRFGRTYRPAEIPVRDGWSQAVGITISIRHKHGAPGFLRR